MVPVNRLWSRLNHSSRSSCPSAGGMVPVNRLKLKSRTCRWPSGPSSGGMDPVNWLWFKSKLCSRSSCPSSGGMDPVNRLKLKSRTCRWPSCPSSGGIVPTRGVDQASSIFTTRPEDGSTPTPSNDPSGRSRCHVRSSSVLAPRSTSRAASSTSWSQSGPDEGSVGGQRRSLESVGTGASTTWPVAAGSGAGSTGTADRPQAPHSRASPTAASFHFRQSMPGPSDGRSGAAARPAMPVDCSLRAQDARTGAGSRPGSCPQCHRGPWTSRGDSPNRPPRAVAAKGFRLVGCPILGGPVS